LPTSVTGYVFKFVAPRDFRAQYEILPEGKDKPVFSGASAGSAGGVPYAVNWDSKGAAEGYYTLIFHAYTLAGKEKQAKGIVRFYHSGLAR